MAADCIIFRINFQKLPADLSKTKVNQMNVLISLKDCYSKMAAAHVIATLMFEL